MSFDIHRLHGCNRPAGRGPPAPCLPSPAFAAETALERRVLRTGPQGGSDREGLDAAWRSHPRSPRSDLAPRPQVRGALRLAPYISWIAGGAGSAAVGPGSAGRRGGPAIARVQSSGRAEPPHEAILTDWGPPCCRGAPHAVPAALATCATPFALRLRAPGPTHQRLHRCNRHDGRRLKSPSASTRRAIRSTPGRASHRTGGSGVRGGRSARGRRGASAACSTNLTSWEIALASNRSAAETPGGRSMRLDAAASPAP